MSQACIYIPKNTRNGVAIYESEDCTFVVEVRRIAGCMRFEYLVNGAVKGRNKASCEDAWEEVSSLLCVPMIEMERKTFNKTYKSVIEQYKENKQSSEEKPLTKSSLDDNLPWK